MPWDTRRFDHILYVQDGVVARRQILECGGTDDDIERMLRRHELTKLSPGVYVNHNGSLTPVQRQWAAVLARWPAALNRESALGEPCAGVIYLAVDRDRNLDPLPGVITQRMTDLDRRTDWRSCPPRLRPAEAVIELMVARLREDDVAGAFAALARACFRRTSADRVAKALARRRRVPYRRMIAALIQDRLTGACSVLERGYLHDVERAHGLPRGERQLASGATGKVTATDVRYKEYGLVVELDGRAFHDNPEARDNDAMRDLAELAVAGDTTARVTHGLVFRDPCRTARWIAAILARLGWDGQVTKCPRCPPE